jgi:hypothetical protein
MITLSAITGRIVLAVTGSATHITAELTLPQAQMLHAELGDLVATLELLDDEPATLQRLIEQVGRANA